MDFYDSRMLLKDRRTGSCGNKVLYSCMGKEVGLYDTFDWYNATIEMDYFVLMRGDTVLTVRKHDDDSPDSLDNLFGFIYANLLTANDLQKSGWYVNGYNKNEHSWSDCFHLMWEYREEMKADRNYWHENGLDAVGKISNLIPPHIRYYANRKAGKRVLIHAVMFYLWLISVLVKRNYKNGEKQTGSISQKNICHLVLSDLGSLYWIKLFNRDKNFNDYFDDADHPIRLFIKSD